MRKSRKEVLGLDLTVYTKNGTLRKRKPKVTNRDYFTQETQDAIIAYSKSENEKERNDIFNKHINYSIYKLAENMVNSSKFPYIETESIESLKHEVVFHLIEQFPKYNPEFGKAYSYFTKISHNYLVGNNDKQYKIVKNRKEMDHVDGDNKVKRGLDEDVSNSTLSHFVKSFIRFVELNIDDIHETRTEVYNEDTRCYETVKDYVVFTDKDKDIVNTILDLLKRAEEIEIFYKPALYLTIRETTGQKTADITRVIKILKCIMKQQSNIYYKKGALDIDETDIYSIT